MKTAETKSQTENTHSGSLNSRNEAFFQFNQAYSKYFFGPTMIQPKLKIGKPNDTYEKQADRVADAVVQIPNSTHSVQRQVLGGDKIVQCQAMEQEEEMLQRQPHDEEEELQMKSESIVQRKCKACEEESLQKKPSESGGSGNIASEQISHQLKTERGSGSRLPASIESEMNQKMGADFSDVNIHTGSEAVQMSKSLAARAFTYGNDIYFNSGEYQPQMTDGKRLLAHELTHVIQQNSGIQRKMIQRACSSEDQTEYESIADEIRELELYQNVPYHHNAIYSPAETRRVAEIIIRQARNRDDCLYYVRYLRTLFSTPEASASSVSQSWGPVLSEAAQEEEDRLQNPEDQQNATFEEDLSGDPNRQWTRVTGQGGKFYYVDATDVSNIFVKAKVKLEGDQQHVDQAKQLEDGIEKEASILGYTVDLEFVDTDGRDVFEAEVDPSEWPTSGNWVGNIEVMAHELHHLLNLDDRYNYIESHSDNEEMYVANRIHWFREEFNRPDDPNRFISFMGEGNLVTDEDICTVIQSDNVSACVNQRQSMRSSGQSDKTSANSKVQRLIEVSSGIIPPTLIDPRGDSSTISNAQTRMNQTAELIFNAPVNSSDIEAALSRIRNFLIRGRIYLDNETAPECRNEHIYFKQNPLTFVICPSVSGLNAEDKQKEFIRVAYRIYQQISVTGRRAAMFGQPLDPANAQKWADFVFQAYNRI